MPKHYTYGPSAAERIIACPGRGNLSKDIKDHASDNVYTREGTMAHDVAERIFHGEDSEEMKFATPEMIRCGKEWAQLCHTADEAASSYVSQQLGIDTDHFTGNNDVRTEQTIVSRELEDFGGTPDILFMFEKAVIVGDYKYGKGVRVNGWTKQKGFNAQLMAYFLLASELNKDAEMFYGFIHQPRLHNYQEILVTRRELMQWKRVFVASMTKNELATGKHCRFCKAIATCPAVQAEAISVLTPLCGSTDGSKAPTIEEQLEMLPRLRRLVEEIPKRALDMLQSGTEIRGFKAVAKLGNRRYTCTEDELGEVLKKKRIPKKEYTETKLLSPAQLDKKGYGSIIQGLVERPITGVTLARKDDPRDELNFTDLEKEE